MEYYYDSDIRTLKLALLLRNADDLKKLASLTGQKPPARKDDMAAVIIRHLEGDSLRGVWQGLDKLQQAAVAEVVHDDSSRFDAARFRAKYGEDPDWYAKDASSRDRAPSPLSFFFHSGIMPADLKARLKEFVPAPRPVDIEAFDQPPANHRRRYEEWNPELRSSEKKTELVPITVHETERTSQRELIGVLRLVDAGKVSVSDKTRRPSAPAIGAIAALLDGGDFYPRMPANGEWRDEDPGPIRAFAWPLILQAGGLAEISGTRLQLTRTGRRSLAEPAAATIRTLWEKWMRTTMFDELARIDCIKGQNGKGKHGLTSASSRREAIAGSLAGCPAGQWVSADELIRYMQACGNNFEVTRNAWTLYICDPQYGSLGYDGSQPMLNSRYLFALLLEYAATLGILDVALIPPANARRDFRNMWGTDELFFFSRYDGLMYFRITPLGAWCLGSAVDFQPAPIAVKQVLQVLPNLEILTEGFGLEESDRLALNAYAVPLSDFAWRLDRGKLLAAIEEGRQVEELREFLAARTGVQLPGDVSRFLDDVADRCTKIQDRGPARLVECADAALADLIANDTRTRKHCLRCGPKHLAVPASSEAAFRRALKDAGYLLSSDAVRPRAERKRIASK